MGQLSAEMMAYYTAVNLIDWFIAGEWGDYSNKIENKVIELLKWLEANADLSPEDVGDANDCGRCESWKEVIDGFRELTETGERIPV